MKTTRIDDGRGVIAKALKDLSSRVLTLHHDMQTIMERQLEEKYGGGALQKLPRGRGKVRYGAFAARRRNETLGQWKRRIGK